jgi:hypothetical protein
MRTLSESMVSYLTGTILALKLTREARIRKAVKDGYDWAVKDCNEDTHTLFDGSEDDCPDIAHELGVCKVCSAAECELGERPCKKATV